MEKSFKIKGIFVRINLLIILLALAGLIIAIALRKNTLYFFFLGFIVCFFSQKILSIISTRAIIKSKLVKPDNYRKGKLLSKFSSHMKRIITFHRAENNFFEALFEKGNTEEVLFKAANKMGYFVEYDGDFTVVLVLPINSRKEMLIDWIKKHLVGFSWKVESDEIIISIESRVLHQKYNYPLFSVVLYDYLVLQDEDILKPMESLKNLEDV
ncbi:MAG: hypothetical protein ACFB0B_13350 [Thermonemataceae bacterium]